ncbi:hypothetical protein KC19_6G087500 [Ceratodon purpureus]|uniref:CID domain-containing protein n=1 Tax=Ceratodon purpureus TaxID=3225 RepID=A0A8T0HD11_CERPU|nr:hypothetical protein KC19_6G087500 [Ceratodon purpureus]
MESTPSSGAFTGATLAEKLNKLNPSQQSIETLSHWCIFHRKKAKEIVDTWASKFHAAPKEKRVPFLYLANDILQNSRRKGPEFVNAFWTVLPAVLRDVLDTGDETVRNSAYRLVNIWEERRVFGSRGQSLREELLGKGLQSSQQEAKQSPPVSHQVFEGNLLERVVESYQAAQEKSVDEIGALEKCTSALSMVVSLEKETENGPAYGDVNTSVAEELLEQELIMRQSVERLESCEKSHALFYSDLKDALFEQENKLEQLRAQLQTAQSQLQKTRDLQLRLASGSMNVTNAIEYSVGGASTDRFDDEESEHQEQDNQAPRSEDSETHISMSSGPASATSSAVTELPAEPMETSEAPTSTPTTTPTTALSTAAEIAAKLTASASSAAMLTSVLSSLAAEEASNGLRSPNLGMDGAQKRPRLENHADQTPSPVPVPYQLPPHLSQFLGSMLPPDYVFQTAMAPPPPPMQSHMTLVQHSMAPPPPPMPPGCNPLYQFQQSPSYYSPPPVRAPPASAPRQ